VDTFSRVYGHSKFGNFLLKTKNKIYTQWEDPGNQSAIYIGPVFQEKGNRPKIGGSNYIFVTLGTRKEPFARLIKAVDDLAKEGTIKEKVVIQGGHTKYESPYLEIFDFCSPEKIDEYILNAKYVITQESAGIGTQCLKSGTRFLVMPRDYEFGELPTKSDMKEDLHWRLEEMGYTKVVKSKGELEKATRDIDALKVGFQFNNHLAVSTLRKALEEA
jgi:UDP-N-acetylglucosamine transferase subunit ALG13